MTDANSACSTSSTSSPMSAWPFGSLVGSSRSMSSTCCRTCSSYARFPRTSAPTGAGVDQRGRGKDCLHHTRQSIGERLYREFQCTLARRAARRRDLLHAARSSDHHRELATSLQYRPAACRDRLPRSRPRGVCAGPRRLASDALTGAKTDPKLTFAADHQPGAGQSPASNPLLNRCHNGSPAANTTTSARRPADPTCCSAVP